MTPKTGTSDKKRHLGRTARALALVTLVAVAASCSQSDAAPASAPADRTTQPQPDAASAAPKPTATAALPPRPEAPVSVEAKVRKLASGELSLPAATSFGSPGFHEVLTDSQTIPADITAATGRRLVLTLRDLGRPDQRCSREHPLSGCATVDWSDSDGRPSVPPGGVFEHRLVLQLASGEESFFLSDSGSLSEAPDRYKPGWPHSAVGGTAREWTAIIPSDVVPGSEMQLRVVMTKFGEPAVRIGYELLLEPEQ